MSVSARLCTCMCERDGQITKVHKKNKGLPHIQNVLHFWAGIFVMANIVSVF